MSNKIFIDGDFNDGYESRIRKSKGDKRPCPTCWGDGKIDLDDDTRSEPCSRCKGSGFINKKDL